MPVAAPLAFWGVSHRLSGFAYRLSVNPAIFIVAGIISLVIASAAVSLMALIVASTIPVKALEEDQ